MQNHKENPCSPTIKLLLREAKKLHKASRSESISKSLPVLRRLIASKVLINISLLELRKNQTLVKRKHILHMLAYEAGYCSWTEYKQIVEIPHEKNVEHYAISLGEAGYPNLWFSTLKDAENYAVLNGGNPIPVGEQAVVIV